MQSSILRYAIAFICLSAPALAWGQLNKLDDMKKSLETSNKDTVAWTHSGVLILGMNEGFLHNWAAGGELASFTVNSIFSGKLERLNRRAVWSNSLDLTYGLQYTYSTKFIPHKTDDRIDFTSKYGYRLDTSKNIYFTGLFNFKSQFTKGYNYNIPNFDSFSTSKFFSPAYFTLAMGLEYRKGSDISFFISPVAARLTLADKYYTTQSAQGAFGVPYGKTNRFEFGAYFSARYKVSIDKKRTYRTRVDLYSNYMAKDRTDDAGNLVRDNPANIAVLFDNLLSWKLSKALNMSIGATFIYDHNVPYKPNPSAEKEDPGKELGWVQLKQFLSFGIEYRF